jgi:hypothetical protein
MAWTQGALADFLAGDLVNPKVGQWAWYDIAEKSSGLTYSVRQAIVGAEKVGKKPGWWFEMEVVPPVGYAQVYRMLLTGPAGDPKNIHKMIVEDGQNPAREIAVDSTDAEAGPMQTATRKLVGTETVKYLKGTIEAEHYVFETAAGNVDVWINDKVAPTGIVRIASDGGDLILREFGEGGEEGTSPAIKRQGPKTNITVKPREPVTEPEPAPRAPKRSEAEGDQP